MSYANGTTNYNLPQTVGTDKRDWSDTNTAFAAVDAALKTAVDGVATDAAAITEIQSELNTPSTGIKARLTAVEDTNTSQGSAISTLQETVLLQGSAITTLQTDVAATAKASAIADLYSDSSTYAVSDVVMYQGVRYVCTTAIEVAESFDASHWRAEDVEEAFATAVLVDKSYENMTWTAILNNFATFAIPILNAMDKLDLGRTAIVFNNNGVFRYVDYEGVEGTNEYEFTRFETASTGTTSLYGFAVHASASYYHRHTIDNVGAVTYTDYSAQTRDTANLKLVRF